MVSHTLLQCLPFICRSFKTRGHLRFVHGIGLGGSVNSNVRLASCIIFIGRGRPGILQAPDGTLKLGFSNLTIKVPLTTLSMG